MKKSLFITLSLVVCSIVYGQSVTSMDEIALKWQDGSYPSRNVSSGMWEPMASGKSDIKFNKGENGKVTSIEIGSDKYVADASTASPFVIYYYSGSDRLYLTESCIVKYNEFSNGPDPRMFWGKKPGAVGAVSKEITVYNEAGMVITKNQEADYAKMQAEKAEVDRLERLKKYSLEGKEVVIIEIINVVVPEKFGHFRGFTYDLVATLKDGTKISTEGFSQGYTSDYTITYSANNYSGTLASGFVVGDKIKITATLKSNPKLIATKDVTVLYNEGVSFNYNGLSWSRSAGEGANSFRIEVKQVKHAVNGSDILMIRILDLSGKLISEFKMGVDQTLIFSAKGGNGGTDNGIGYNGGDGGNLTVIKDPSVKEFNISYTIQGGYGSSGHTATATGHNGRDGVYKEEVRAVKM